MPWFRSSSAPLGADFYSSLNIQETSKKQKIQKYPENSVRGLLQQCWDQCSLLFWEGIPWMLKHPQKPSPSCPHLPVLTVSTFSTSVE